MSADAKAWANNPGTAIGDRNRESVRKFFMAHLGCTNVECAAALGISVEAIGRHIKTIRREWAREDEAVKTITYPAHIERISDDEYVITFPDIPEALTSGATEAEAIVQAADALEEAILSAMQNGRPVPKPREAQPGEVDIPLAPETASALSLKWGQDDAR